MVFSDASFAGDLRDSKSTSGGVVCLVGPRTFVPLTWMCKKQGATSHSSTEAEIIALDAMLRMEGIPALGLWESVVDTLEPAVAPKPPKKNSKSTAGSDAEQSFDIVQTILKNVDWVPPSLPPHTNRVTLIILEDNDAVIKMVLKGRSPALRHVVRTHRVDLDFVFEAIRDDRGITIKFISTKEQMADI